jgi:hypothetical protein
MHELGLGVAKDAKAASEWYGKALSAGRATALLHIGRLHAEGKALTKDEAEARRHFQRAANSPATDVVWTGVLRLFELPEFALDRQPHQTATLMLLTLAEEPKHRERMVADAARLPQGVRVAVQARLRAAGHYTGRVNGTFDAATKAALDAWAVSRR